jgi:hypothetical protein
VSELLSEQIASVNARMMELLQDARKALRGESNFGVEEIRQIRKPLDEMDPVMRRSEELRKSFPDISPQLDLYKSHLAELLSILDHLHVMLLAKQANVLAGRAQLDAASHWLAAFQVTR